jgi:hypothetical protein
MFRRKMLLPSSGWSRPRKYSSEMFLSTYKKHGATLKVDAAYPSEMFVSITNTTRHEPEDRGCMLLRNVRVHLQNYMLSQTWRPHLKDRWVRIARKFGVWSEVARNKFRKLTTCVIDENRSRKLEVELWILNARGSHTSTRDSYQGRK